MSEPAYTRREAQKLTPELLQQYHVLVWQNDFAGFDELLGRYDIPEKTKEELRADFRLYAEKVLLRRWRSPR